MGMLSLSSPSAGWRSVIFLSFSRSVVPQGHSDAPRTDHLQGRSGAAALWAGRWGASLIRKLQMGVKEMTEKLNIHTVWSSAGAALRMPEHTCSKDWIVWMLCSPDSKNICMLTKIEILEKLKSLHLCVQRQSMPTFNLSSTLLNNTQYKGMKVFPALTHEDFKEIHFKFEGLKALSG